MHLRRLFTEEEKEIIAANYATMSAAKLGKLLDRPRVSIKNYVARYRLGKDGRSESHFKPGSTPWNAGIPYRPAKRDPSKKPAYAPHNAYYDGMVTTRQRPNDKPYKFRRIAPSKWVLSHRWNWEQVHGPVPAGCVLRCQDGDTLNDEPSNWQPVSRRQNAELAGIWSSNRAGELLTPSFLAATLTRGRPELRPLVLASPELLEVQRLKITLNRTLKS